MSAGKALNGSSADRVIPTRNAGTMDMVTTSCLLSWELHFRFFQSLDPRTSDLTQWMRQSRVYLILLQNARQCASSLVVYSGYLFVSRYAINHVNKVSYLESRDYLHTSDRGSMACESFRASAVAALLAAFGWLTDSVGMNLLG